MHMPESGRISLPFRIVMLWILTIALVYLMSIFLERTFFLTGGLYGYLIIGSLITLMNLIVRPVLVIITYPFKLFAGIIVLIFVNGGILWLTQRIAEKMDPSIVTLQIDQGIGGWILVALILGLGNWFFKHIVR
jgi:uncharacterized membrane protein YvlD (DUF360 family)